MLFHKSIKVLLLILLFNRSLAVSIKNAEQQEECDKPVIYILYLNYIYNNYIYIYYILYLNLVFSREKMVRAS